MMEKTNLKEIFHLKGFEKSYGYAQAVKVGNLLYVSGTVSIDDEGKPRAENDMQVQVQYIYMKIFVYLLRHLD
ncbi:MAG: hypothetical protein L6Q46_01910 [Flavobacterium sp.]|uniref:hypothetical protein n=1 Tax=Flavobacterium sp. TaxID=239 RepID=UPI0025BB683A|nr:hypothetical protein [Flavobacterium sp.]MCK6607041.1 hypothetical protein [Flavobacterium sp.]